MLTACGTLLARERAFGGITAEDQEGSRTWQGRSVFRNTQSTLHAETVDISGDRLKAVRKFGRISNLLPLCVARRQHPAVVR